MTTLPSKSCYVNSEYHISSVIVEIDYFTFLQSVNFILKEIVSTASGLGTLSIFQLVVTPQ